MNEEGKRRFKESGLKVKDVAEAGKDYYKDVDTFHASSAKKKVMTIVYNLFGMLDENGKKR